MSVPLLYLAKSFPASGGPSDTAWDTSELMVLLALGAAEKENLPILADEHLSSSWFHRISAK